MSNAVKAEQITADQALQLKNNDAIFIDVREPAEFNNAHIQEAKLHSLGKISAQDLASHGDKTIVIYCQKGVRGNKACDKIFKDNPNAKIVNLEGGIEAWQKAGFAINKGSSNVLPLDRQVQITIGGAVVVFTVLATLLHPNFVYGAMFMGAGLLFAGLSGFCGMARLMALAPWNK